MADFRYSNAITTPFPTANGNAADSDMIALIEKPLPCRKPKKEWKFNCRSWIKNSSTAASPKLKQNTS